MSLKWAKRLLWGTLAWVAVLALAQAAIVIFGSRTGPEIATGNTYLVKMTGGPIYYAKPWMGLAYYAVLVGGIAGCALVVVVAIVKKWKGGLS